MATKKKVRKSVVKGIVHVHASFNNTIVTITDLNGETVAWDSAGTAGFKGARKATPFAASRASERAASKASALLLVAAAPPATLRMRRRGPGYGREVRAGIALGFAYWILTGTALSAGRTGALPPLLAAWTANAATATLALAAWAAGRLSARR